MNNIGHASIQTTQISYLKNC